MYLRDKDVLRGQLAGLVVCLTTDTWTSIQNMNYMSLTVHFVDADWVLHKKIIKFCQITDHKGETIGKALEAAIKEWGLEKVLSVSVDNASSNDVALGYLKNYLKDANKTFLGGEYLHVRCAAHILNLIVTEGLKDVDDSVARIRMAVKWVRSSPSRLEKFKVAAKAAGITSKKGLCTDVPTRWNSTFLMFEVAHEYKAAFQLLGDEDIQYVKYFDEHGGSRKPNDDDWVVVSTFVDFLGLFYDVTLNISGSLYPTSHGFCQQICRVKEELEDMRRGSNERMRGMVVTMMLKYDKYWGDLTRMNIFLYVAVILDPRLKVSGLLYGLGLVHDQVWTDIIGELARDTLKKLFDEFMAIKGGTTSKTHTPTPTPSTDIVTGPPTKKRRMPWTKTLAQNPTLVHQSTEVVSELDNYLSADMVQDDDDHWDILGWWKNASKKYPIISEIARCILAIPISTVASESAFSTGGRILDPFRSSLSPTTVEALICTQSWTIGKDIHVPDILDFKETDEGGDQSGFGPPGNYFLFYYFNFFIFISISSLLILILIFVVTHETSSTSAT